MREILFKAKRLDNGEWTEGYVVFVADRSRATIFAPQDTKEFSWSTLPFAVDPSTVCEYTGLEDINGKRIFEGDILQDDAGNVWLVSYEAGAFGYSNAHCAGLLFDNVVHEAEIGTVVGNIFDNPELLNL